MAYDGNGLYELPAPQYPAIPGTTILAEDFNDILVDLAAALSAALVRDGQSAMTGPLNMGDQAITGIDALTAKTAGMAISNVTALSAALAGLIISGTVSFSGSVSAVTPAVTDDSTTLATTAFVQDIAFGDPYNGALAINMYRNY